MKLSHPEPQYEDRLTTLARGMVYRGCRADDIKAEIERRREREGDAVANDLRMLCREMWRRLGL